MTTTATGPRVHHKPDEADRELLNQLQAGLAFVREPFAEVGSRIGMDEEEVLRRLTRLKEASIVRQLSAIFDTRALGYRSSLVAARYPADRLFEGADIVGGHPGVSHNYRRTHAFNLWYTLAVDPESRIGLEETMERLHAASGAESTRLLPTLKLYKINVQLDMTGSRPTDAKEEAPKPAPRRGDGVLPTDEDKRLILLLQRDLPVVSRPFDDWAEEAGMAPQALLDACQVFVDRAYMRRFAAVLNHRKAGFGANGMAVWKVPEDQLEEIGPRMAAFKAVSHCYKRPTYPDWPYSIFTMVHARSKEACEEAIAAIAEDTGITDPDRRAVLYSTYEFKKIRLLYFTPDYREWEDRALAGQPLPRWKH
ncbi:AsnC family transcriptional regulator [Miltoncostaea marina]|uniref:siroheme decarboxylase subunit beta n=1 Tax=Miltoncostaea marina TaxID=2843215 RepID=UPI001C3CFE71|nr:AsnC family transcriptional regulator [Miltoncostaea marina]